ncbi:uncharacterized protein [Euphorbia lathyris]|uniref:uncharacterized protein n=1 Tax=Euphorbia lathyris TaxID=212925 RepID=UPI003313D736
MVWEELLNFRLIPQCKCNLLQQSNTSCEAVKKTKEYQEQDYIIRFLRGVNESFASVKSQLLLMDPIPSITKTFNLLVQHERQLHQGASSSFDRIDSTVNFAKTQNAGQKKQFYKKNGWPICSYCGKENHTVDQCYKKHGFPPNFKFTKKRSFAANVFTQEGLDSQSISPSIEVSGSTNFLQQQGFTSEQCQRLISMLNQAEMKENHENNHSLNVVQAQQTASVALQPTFATGHFDPEEDWYS